ncbi:hypothetical protein B0T26DRAFT_508047 [Lasiosphaeria miniovina]|uniref:Uncharacterized protein n=1 Tax=Lasiosphaeria miniovina TaxID=1954250 RepID=A0AA39ZTV8_9PEZI|nr:uncharacterized protein B0T26DRAFT_508047 [Lasiosphaeria miniovina]KAK0703634.1 hypothetical protein B0T26DRAFT_508047 [Lasiosphaeria miniovina]
MENPRIVPPTHAAATAKQPITGWRRLWLQYFPVRLWPRPLDADNPVLYLVDIPVILFLLGSLAYHVGSLSSSLIWGTTPNQAITLTLLAVNLSLCVCAWLCRLDEGLGGEEEVPVPRPLDEQEGPHESQDDETTALLRGLLLQQIVTRDAAWDELNREFDGVVRLFDAVRPPAAVVPHMELLRLGHDMAQAQCFKILAVVTEITLQFPIILLNVRSIPKLAPEPPMTGYLLEFYACLKK